MQPICMAKHLPNTDMNISKNHNFFDSYPNFYTTSNTTPFRNRLNSRFLALIDNNRDLIDGSSVLDLASHDGRWSFAAIKTGATFVLGIEARLHLLANANANMQKYGIPSEKYSFILGDVHSEIEKIPPNTYDIIFCFGFFYHTMNHMILLSEIQRINPKYLILDTGIAAVYNQPVIEVREENSEDEPMAVKMNELNNNNMVLAGLPSRAALELMLRHSGFNWEYFDWQHAGIQTWEHIEDYRDNIRVSLRCKNLSRI